MAQQSLQGYRVSDPVLTTVVHGYCQADSIAPFIAPTVPVSVRGGKVVKFGKEQFAIQNTRRSPGSTIQRVTTGYSSENYSLNQHALGSEVTEEAYQEALNGEARIDLRNYAALRTSENIMLSWEQEVVDTITDSTKYEANNQEVLAGAAQFSDASSDPEKTVQDWKEAVRTQIGCYPNSMVISTDVFTALKFHPVFRDRVKYTSVASINLDMLATWFDLPRGIRVANKVALNASNELVDIMPSGTAVLFYSPETKVAAGFMPQAGADKATPSYAYTYMLDGYPIATPERLDEDRRVYVSDIIIEQSLQLTGLGATGKVGAGFLATDVV